MKLKRRDRILASIVLGGLLLLGVSRWVFFNAWSRMRNLSRQITATEADLKLARAIQSQRDKIRAEYVQYQGYLELGALTDREVTVRFLGEIERIAQNSKVAIVNLNPQSQPEAAEGFRRYTADLKLEAGVEPLLTFLHGIQSSPLLMKLPRLSVVPRDNEGKAVKGDTAVHLWAPAKR